MRITFIFFIITVFPIFSKGKFASSYTDFAKDCKGDPSVRDGDIPQICKGPAGFTLYITYSACSEFIRILDKKKKEILSLPEQTIGSSDKKKLEWRILDGRPIAVIYRISIYEESSDDPCTRKKKKEELGVYGIGKYSDLSKTVSGKNENEKARQTADEFILGKK